MTWVASEDLRILKQRGFWLRCFLGAAFVLLILAVPASSQVDIPKPERLTHVQGIVVDPEGHPVPNLQVRLVRDEKVQAETQTSKSGTFKFDRVRSGQYIFRVARSQYAPAARDIVVTDEIVTHLERKQLFVVLGPGACQDECSAVLTSRRKFDQAIRKNNRH